jgi:ParB/RepB/Spo0J family partition protein
MPETTCETTKSFLLPIDRLDPHPLNSNVMPKALMDKLARSIERTGLYPPVIVRPVGERYQILDGHHRVQVLKRLKRAEVQAVIWPVDEEQAMVMLASLNRMRGEDDPRKRADLVATLSRTMNESDLAKRLPEDVGRVKKLLALHRAPPPPTKAVPIDAMPVSLHFFLLPAQRRAIERRLAEHGGPREAALLALLGIDDTPTETDR